jgi:hypothetical protein
MGVLALIRDLVTQNPRELRAADGDLLLKQDPTTVLGAATKQYVDLRVLKSGDTMTGALNGTTAAFSGNLSSGGVIQTNGFLSAGASNQIVSPGPAYSGVGGVCHMRPDGVFSLLGYWLWTTTLATATTPLQLPANAVAPLQAVPLQQLQSLIPDDYISGLKMVWVSNTSISVSSGAAVLASTGSLLTNTGTLTLTPSLAASTFYHVYLYNNAGTAAIEAVTTAPDAAYFGTARAKTGDTSRRYIGSVLTDASGNIFPFVHSGTRISYAHSTFVSPFRVLVAGAATAMTPVATSAVIPLTAPLGQIRFQNSSTVPASFGPGAPYSVTITSIPAQLNSGPGPLVIVDTILGSDQSFIYDYSTTGGNLYADVLGYTYER